MSDKMREAEIGNKIARIIADQLAVRADGRDPTSLDDDGVTQAWEHWYDIALPCAEQIIAYARPLLSSVKEDGVPSVPSVLGKEQGLSEASQTVAPPARWKHKKRGTIYEVLGVASVQQATDQQLYDFAPVVVYRGEDGMLWVRHEREFMDGRFERVSDEHPSGRDLGLGAKPASAIREAETPVTPPAKGETR